MRAINCCRVREVGKSLQRSQHLCGRAFKKTTTSGTKERIAAEKHPWQMVSKVTQGMTRNRHHSDTFTQHINPLPAMQGMRPACDRLARRSVNCGLPACRQGLNPPLMIRMVVSNQDAFQAQAVSIQSFNYRSRITGIDDKSTLPLA